MTFQELVRTRHLVRSFEKGYGGATCDDDIEAGR